jgi:hypothetical protein
MIVQKLNNNTKNPAKEETVKYVPENISRTFLNKKHFSTTANEIRMYY